MSNLFSQKIIILDFGSQYTQLIARRVRELGVYSEIKAWDARIDASLISDASGIILSGGPESVTDGANAPKIPEILFSYKIPILGICYGMQAIAKFFGGEVQSSSKREFGYARLKKVNESLLLEGVADHRSLSLIHI